jgi:hypothetical protein
MDPSQQITLMRFTCPFQNPTHCYNPHLVELPSVLKIALPLPNPQLVN